MSIAINAAPEIAAAPPSAGRLRDEGITDTDRNFAVAIHLSPLAALIFGPALFAPLVLWLIRRNESSFNDDHGREAVNAVISFVLYHFVAAITIIGILALPALYILALVNVVRGAISARRGEYFRYPMTIRFLS